MTYNNLIYLNENTLYYKNNNKVLELSFKEDIVYKLNKKDFIKKYQMFLKENKLGFFIYNKTIHIIYDSFLSKHDLNYLKNIFYEIGYKDVILKSDLSLLDISKKNNFLITGVNDKFIYVDNYNQKRQLVFQKNTITLSEEVNIIQKRVKNNNLIIIGNSINNVDKINNYYIIENKAKFFLGIDT